MRNTFIGSRRQLFGNAGRGVLAGWLGRIPVLAAPRVETNIYQRIGVQPVINCKGTFTIISGSLSLPEVKKAMDEASRHYVHMDELMDGVGRRLAEVTKAEWGIVTAGCAAALTHATAACIAGGNPEKMQRLPKLDGLKNEVVMPRQSRNVYDHAIRMTGVKMLSPATREEFLASFGPHTAMLALLGEALASHPMKLEEMTAVAHQHGVPVIVDAAAERLTIPNFYLAGGADMVAYSGGKGLRGPQCAGLLLGRKDLLEAAWANSCSTSCLRARAEGGQGRDHGHAHGGGSLDHSRPRRRMEAVAGMAGHDSGERRLDSHRPYGDRAAARSIQLRAAFGGELGHGKDWRHRLRTGRSSAERKSAHRNAGRSELAQRFMPYMMMPGDDKLVAPRIRELLSNPPRRAKPAPSGSAAQVGGEWDVEITYTRDHAVHTLFLEQNGDKLQGSHRGEFLTADTKGSVDGSKMRCRSLHHYEGTSIGYTFEGVVDGDTIRGTVDVGEYGKAPFTARRHFHA